MRPRFARSSRTLWPRSAGWFATPVHRCSTTSGWLPESVETVVYRVVQEAVTNAARHAAAGRIDVSIDCQRDFVVTTVEDDGRGFDVRLALRRERHPFGLLSMRERAAALGGSIDVASGSGGGTRVRITLPLRDERAAT